MGIFFSGTIFLSETKLLFQNHFISHQIQVNSTSSFFLWKNFKNSSLKKGNMLFHSTYSVRKIQYSHFFCQDTRNFQIATDIRRQQILTKRINLRKPFFCPRILINPLSKNGNKSTTFVDS